MVMDPVQKIYLKREKELIADLKQYKAPPSNRFRASELGDCPLRIYFRLAGFIPSARNPRGEDYGRDGDMHHDQVRRFLVDNGVKLSGLKFNKDGTVDELISEQLKVHTAGGVAIIGMRLDGFIQIGTKRYVLEIKSVSEGKLRSILKSWEESGMPENVAVEIKEKHLSYLYQTHACMKQTKVPQAYVLFKDRSGCAVGLHSKKDSQQIIGGPVIQFDKHVWDTIVRKLGGIMRALKTSTPPFPAHSAPSQTSECQYYCDYKHLCFEADKRKKTGKGGPVHPQLGAKLHVNEL